MLAIQIGYGETVSDEYALPLSSEERAAVEAIVKVGANAHLPVIIQSVKSSVFGLSSYLEGLNYEEYKTTNELNLLAERIQYLTGTEQDVLSAALELEQPGSLKEIINLSYNLRNYELFQNINDLETLAVTLVERDKQAGEQEPMMDDTQVQGTYFERHKGAFCPSGFVLKRDDAVFEEIYNDYLPDPGYETDSVFLLHLFHKLDKKMLYFSLAIPASEEKLELARKVLEVSDFSACKVNQYGGPKDRLWHYLPIGSRVEDLNQFSAYLKEHILDGSDEQEIRLMAALEAECPRNLEEAARIASDLSRYTILSDMRTPEDYAQYVVEHDDSFYVAPLCRECLDWEAVGYAAMNRYGTMLTAQGIVTCDEWCCERLSDEEVVTRLFSPICGEIEDFEGYQSFLSASRLTAYQYDIKKAIEYNRIQENRKGLGEYLDNQLLKQRIISMFPTVETYQYQLWGVLEIKSHGPLFPEELEVVKREWEGQAADGWGESFEQEEIDCGEECTLYVRFWDRGYQIKTEQELKGIPEEQEGMQMGGLT